MKSLFLFYLTFWSIVSFAQNSVESYINDKDGFTNVRKEKTVNSEILTTIKNAELFKCQPNLEGNWWKIETKSGISGYVHSSRIITVEHQAKKSQNFSIRYQLLIQMTLNLEKDQMNYFTRI